MKTKELQNAPHWWPARILTGELEQGETVEMQYDNDGVSCEATVICVWEASGTDYEMALIRDGGGDPEVILYDAAGLAAAPMIATQTGYELPSPDLSDEEWTSLVTQNRVFVLVPSECATLGGK